ncbi:vasoactive intestinal polypeptide receptor-like [Amblyraja radiata]|uniref:vasoactive intestinal polypeptide receptor-like n=1 Tax=Amblyraja radiata TaxID=386614 RepID=UPI001401F3DC|nr:vasoactive intestinal polypeptide receptor-like [Amblyraja radiata]
MNFAQVSALLLILLTQFPIPRVLCVHQECNVWSEVARLREECLWNIERENQSLETGCSRLWENVTCWPPARDGEVVVVSCIRLPGLFLNPGANVSRNCTSTGWSMLQQPYKLACGYNENGTPSDEKQNFYEVTRIGYTIGYSLSLLSLSVAVVILCIFSKLHCTRNYIHMHLFISFILRAIAVFVKDLVLFQLDPCYKAPAGCKAAVVFFQYCIMANFFWLLVEGLYLHTLLVISFFSEKRYFWWYIPIGWGTPLPFIIIWVITKVHFDDFACWQIIDSPFWWIIRTPILIAILVNFVLFTCIIRILIQKLHSPDVGLNQSNQHLRLAKSTLLLIPLFGINYIAFAFFPDQLNPKLKIVFDLVLGSFQGFIVAILYCFLNGEVQSELKRKWRRWHIKRVVGGDMKYHQPSVGSNGTNCTTQISMLTKCSPKITDSNIQTESSIS